ncbi:MAG: T9SS type A sorting domain-containing protein [Chitinophagales bacterium]|nr:T9SS type A sorting domain-containing protein [Chitinophagales bacterium]
MKFQILLTFSFLAYLVKAQEISIKTYLDNEVNETSGLLNLNGKIYTLNDSGGEAIVYELDTINGSVLSRKYITNATNIDWEALTADNNFVYIADFGNNNGSRTNLRIYKVSISNFVQTDSLVADTIQFSYENQTDFTPSNSHNFDAEAIVALDDSLYIFTKNWGNFKTYIYSLSKNEGISTAYLKDSVSTEGLTTDAVYNEAKQQMVLLGYSFLCILNEVNSTFDSFSSFEIENIILPPNSSFQTEGICNSQNAYFISAESFNGNTQVLYQYKNTPTAINTVENKNISIYPNPANGYINIEHTGKDLLYSEVYNIGGEKILTTAKTHLSLTGLSKGTYLIKIYTNNALIKTEKFIIK